MSDLPEYLSAVLIFLGVLGVLNLAVTLALLRKIHQQNALMRMSIEGLENPVPIMLTAGAAVGPFAGTTVDGDPVSEADLDAPTLVGFLSPECPACADMLPAFMLRAIETPGGRDQVLAVVVGSDDAAAPLRSRLSNVARVVVEPQSGPLAQAFGVTGFPAFALVDEKTVVGSSFAMDRVPEAAPT